MSDFVDPTRQSLAAMTQECLELKKAALDESRPHAVTAQHKRGRLTARERVDQLVDSDSFSELGQLARSASRGEADPGDGIVVGRARVDRRPVVVVSYDFTVDGGSMGRVNDEKFARARQISLRTGVPLVMLVEGGGARITERMGSTTIRGHERFSDLGLLSGWAPILCGVVGPTYAGHANLVALSDFVVMLKGASLGLAGPRLVRAATGEDVQTEDFGPAFHARTVGSVELEVDTEQELFRALRNYLRLMPSNSSMRPPRTERKSRDELLSDEVLSLIPGNSQRPYDMRSLIGLILDEEDKLELKPSFARNIVTTLGRIGGHVVGVVANNPMFMAGVLDSPASDKMARFINICDAYGIPIVVLVDVPGYMVGKAAEKTNLMRRSMRPLWEISQSTVPILTVVVRKAYGLAYHTMGGAEFHPELMVCWPSARVSPMGAEGAVNILYGKDDTITTEFKAEQVRHYKSLEEPIVAASEFKIDDIIDPRETRRVLLETLDFIDGSPHASGHWRPPKKRGIAPV